MRSQKIKIYLIHWFYGKMNSWHKSKFWWYC